MNATLEPSDPQPGESGTSFAGFVLYREMHPDRRSLREVARRLGKTSSLIDRYSSRWNWVARARTWDKEQARLTSRRRAEVVTEWIDRQAEDGRRLQVFGMAALERYIDRDADGLIVGVHGMRARDALLMMKLGAQIERTAAGVEPLGVVDSEFVSAVAEAFTTAFQEVNNIDDEAERAATFQRRCLEAVRRLIAAGDGDSG